MKQGATYFVVCTLKEVTDLTKLDKIIFTFEGTDKKQVQKVYPTDVKYDNGSFLIPLHQDDTLTLKGLVKLEAQINFKDKSVAKSEIANTFVGNTLATEKLDGNTPNTDSTKEIGLSIDGTISIGIDGATFIPHVERLAENSIRISWTNESGLDNPEPVTLIAPKGEKGDKGEQGIQGEKGEDGKSFTWAGEYNSSIAYHINDIVSYNGSAYICVTESPSTSPDNPIDWNLMVEKGAYANVDTEIDNTSANPVENRAISAYLEPILGVQTESTAPTFDFTFSAPINQNSVCNCYYIKNNVGGYAEFVTTSDMSNFNMRWGIYNERLALFIQNKTNTEINVSTSFVGAAGLAAYVNQYTSSGTYDVGYPVQASFSGNLTIGAGEICVLSTLDAVSNMISWTNIGNPFDMYGITPKRYAVPEVRSSGYTLKAQTATENTSIAVPSMNVSINGEKSLNPFEQTQKDIKDLKSSMPTSETWTFTLSDDTTVNKNVAVRK